MEIVENRALKLRLRNPAQVLNVIPKSTVIGDSNGVSEVLVHWGIEEAQVLKNLRIKNEPRPVYAPKANLSVFDYEP